jgi:mannose-6-phosphate isomerase-like protein (cupin superfamily)
MHALSTEHAKLENWEGMPFRALLPPGISGRLEVYELQVRHATPHSHDHYNQVYIVKSGHGLMQIEAETQQVGPGWLVFIPRGQRHSLEPLDDEPVIVYSIIEHVD